MMSTSQDIITCDICKQEPLHHFCNGCEIRLCKNCVVTHLESESVEGHTIVQYKHRDARNIQPKVCYGHPSMLKILYCKKCSAQICLSCVAEHEDHMLEVVDLKQFVNSQYIEIVKISEHLNIKSLPKCRLSIEKMRVLLEEANTKYDQERQKIFDVGELLHCKIKEEVDDLLAEIDKQKKETLEKLQDLKKCTEEKLQEIDKTIEMCEATKSSLDEILKFTFDESSLDIAQTIEVTFPQFKTPRACTLDVGLLKSIKEERRLIDKPLDDDKPGKEIKKEGECQVQILFIENPHAKPIDNLLKNCRRYKGELRFDKELDEASVEYRILLKKSSSTGSRKTSPPYEISFFDDEEKRCQAPFLYDIISLISKRYPNTRWKKAMTEFIGLTAQMGPKRQEEEKEEEVYHNAKDGESKDLKTPVINVLFLEYQNLQPIANFLENCRCFKDDFQFGEELDEAVTEYKCLLKKAKETGCPVPKNAPPSQLNAVTLSEKRQAPCLYVVISDVAKRCQNAKWMDAVTEFITLTTISQSEPRHTKHQRPRSTSGYQKKKEKEYRNSIDKLLDQEWDPVFIPKAAVGDDYRHFYTSESVLRSSFPDAYIFNMASSTLSKPDDVPLEFRERTLFHFLLSTDMKKYGVNPEDAWRDFGRCILSEKQLDLARRAVVPDLDKYVIVSKHTFYKLQNEVKEKTLTKFTQLTEGNPNIAVLLSDVHRPTRLGEMYSQLFDDEWSEAFEAFKPKKDEDDEEEDDDIFPYTLFILQNMLKEIFEFCKTQSQKQLVQLEESFATVIGLKESKVKKQKDEKRTEENQIDGEGDSNEQPMASDEGVQEKEIEETDDTSDNKQLKDIQTPPADNGGEHELLQQPKLSTDKIEKEANSGEANDNQTDEDKSGSTGTDNKDSEKDLTKEEVGDQPKPSEGDNDNNNQDTTVTDHEKEEKDTSNNINNDTELDKSINVEGKPKETSDETQEGEQASDNKAADPGEPKLDRNEVPNEKVNSEGQTSEKTGDKASSEDQNKELLKSVEQPNKQQSAGKETSEDGEKKQEDKPKQPEGEEVPDKEPEEEDGGNEPDGEEEEGPEEEEEDRTYRADPAFPMIERHAREFRKASAGTSAKTKSTLFIKVELPNLVADEGIRGDLRTLTYVRKCVELCWYMCMQDPPMVIINPERGQEIDKGLFSLHGRRGKTVEVCVWPALLLHDGGPLVCKGYVLPEERKRKK